MSAWVLIGYLSIATSWGGGGPVSAEFATREACLAARATYLDALSVFPNGAKVLHCVPKGGSNG